MVLWGRSVLGRQKVPRKVPPRFQQGCTKVPPRFFKFRGVSASLEQIRLGLPQGSVLKGSVEGSPRFHQGFTEVPPRFHQGCASFAISLVLGVPKGSVEGSPITSLNWSPSSSTLFCSFPQQRYL